MVLALLNAFKPAVCALHFRIIFPHVLGIHDCFCVRAAAGSITQRVCLDKVDFLPPADKTGYQDKMRNTVNVKFVNLVRDLTLTPFWYLPHLLFATTLVKVHLCYAQSAVVCNHTAQIPNPNSMLSSLNNITLLHIHHEGFSAWVPTHP